MYIIEPTTKQRLPQGSLTFDNQDSIITKKRFSSEIFGAVLSLLQSTKESNSEGVSLFKLR